MSGLRSILPGIALAAAMSVGPVAAQDVTINALFMSQAAYSEADVRSMIADFEAANPGIKVNPEFVASEALHDKLVASASAGSGGYDVALYDVPYLAEFASKGFLQDVTARVPAEVNDQVFDGAWATATFEDKKWGMPWILDTKYLFYNKEMLAKAGISEPPKTFEELREQAQKIKDAGIVEFPIVGDWAQAETVICDYGTLMAAYQANFFEGGEPAFDSPNSLKAVQYMKDALDAGLVNPSSTEYFEEDVRKVFSAGEAAFALNWAYMFNLANNEGPETKIAGQVGIAPAPGAEGGAANAAINGSMGLGIPTNASNPDAAWKLITFMTSQPVQNKYAKLSLPIWKSSYDDPAVSEGQPDLVAAAKTSIAIISNRPVTPTYNEVSAILQAALQSVLVGGEDPAAAMAAAKEEASNLR
jgi:multiple sugar transport system substrate-binding protein